MGKFKTVFVTTLCFLVSYCSQAQDLQVSLSKKNISFDRLFEEITRQTGYSFFYDTETLLKAGLVDIHVKALTLKKVLDYCFNGRPFTYEIVDKMVVVRQRGIVPPRRPSIGKGKLSGVVKDSKTDTPVSGVTVRLYGNGHPVAWTITDHDGHYAFFKLFPGNYKMTFNFLGYGVSEKVFLLADGQHLVYHTVLQEVIGHLNDVVIVGYGQVRKGDLTGSVSSVGTKDIKDVPSKSFDDALAGKVPGLQVTKADGSPGGAVRMNIRGGISLLGTNDPLYIIDGIPVSVHNRYILTSASIWNAVETSENFANTMGDAYSRGFNTLTGLNLNDIENIDVLKDASSAAIYGSKAANGVVIITTKSGRLHTGPVINFNYYAGLNTPLTPKLLHTKQYIRILTESGQELPATIDPNINTDWLKLITRKGFTQNADLAIGGGGTSSSYYASLSYTNEGGTLLATGFKRVAGKVNFEHYWTPRFHLITNFNLGYTQYDMNSGVYGYALHAPPYLSPYNADGSFTSIGLPKDGKENPLALTKVMNKGRQYLMLGKIAIEYDWNKKLKWRSAASVNYSDYRQLQFVPRYVSFVYTAGEPVNRAGTSFGANAASSAADILYENTLTWNLKLKNDHELNLLAGTSWETDQNHGFEAEGVGFADQIPPAQLAHDIGDNNKSRFTVSSNLFSLYIRANYSYKHNYLFTFTGRADASSKYPETNRAAYFPSAAFAWRMSGEDFLKGQLWIDDIKLRVSAGKTGLNANIGANLYGGFYQNINYAGSRAIILYQAASQNFKWESVWQNDIGVDFSLFRGRLNGTISYYHKGTDGLLLGADLPPSGKYALLIQNTGGLNNKGLEVNLQGIIIRSEKFIWGLSFNIARNISKVTNIHGSPFSDPLDRSLQGNNIVEEGKPLNLFYGYLVQGLLKTEDEVTQYRRRLNPKLDQATYDFEPGIGGYKYALDAAGIPKKGIIGNGNPKFYGGLTQDISFRRFSLNAVATYAYGNQLLYRDDYNNMMVYDDENKGLSVLDHFTSQNTGTNRPAISNGNRIPITNNNVYNASYLKMRSLTVSYNLPKNITEPMNLKNLSLYITGTNLFTLTKYPGPDPEVSNDPRSTTDGYSDVSSYPTTRSYLIGVRATL